MSPDAQGRRSAADQNSPKFSNLVEACRWRAAHQGEAIGFTFLVDGERQEANLSYADLDRAARMIAAELLARGAAGERVLLLFNPGVDFISAMFGCLYAGAVAVPVYPPDPMRIQRTLPRLKAIVEDAQARFVLGHEQVLGQPGDTLWNLCEARTILLEAIDASRQAEWTLPDIDENRLGLLQYTSGSTGTPRGVMLTHGNIAHNCWAMHQMVDYDGAVGLLWVPPYHDMGLIGGILQPLYSGRKSVLMSPVSFLQRPVRWLQAFSRYRGTTTGAPNFGYELCVRKIREEDCEDLDLESWTVAVDGAEPVRAETIDRFVKKFARYGFRREAFYPAFGLAEATLIVSGGRPFETPFVRDFSAPGLKENQVTELAGDSPDTRRLVGCGQAMPGGEIAICDAATGRRLPPETVGEIWFKSPAVGIGYWNRPEETAQVFDRCPIGEREGGYLRTGDLGFLYEDELFITGRAKELIIIRGRNYYPHDIERTAQHAHRAAKPDGGAAFSIDDEGEDRLVVVQEVLRPKKYDLDEVLRAVRDEVTDEHELAPDAVVLIAGGTLPRTSSGKTQRRACREMFLAGELQVVAQWRARRQANERAEREPGDGLPTSAEVARAEYVSPRTPTEKLLCDTWAEVLGVERVGLHDNFFHLGGSSLLATQLVSRLDPYFEVEVPLSGLFDRPTVAALAEALEPASIDSQDQEALAALLERLETMSEKEAEAMIANHESDAPRLAANGQATPKVTELDYLVIGAGPAGLQLGFYLEKSGRNYQILEAGSSAGNFFQRFPRHRQLLSINKIYTGYDDPEVNLRWDWNSLLSDHDDAMTLKHYSRDYFPSADELVRYLEDYAEHFKLKIKYDTEVTTIRKDGKFHVEDRAGNVYRAGVLVVASGCAKAYVPDLEGIELAENYTDMSVDPEDFAGQRVLILGKGNSAFETANHLLGTTSLMHLASPESIKMAWRSHFVGHVRSVNNMFMDSYLLKAQNALLDAEVLRIERRDGALVATVEYGHAAGEVEELVYDRVLVCTGFRFDDSIFDASCKPTLAIRDRFPAQTSEWESTNIRDLYFAGTLMQMRDFKKKQSGFIHGFRYNVELLSRILEQKHEGRELRHDLIPRDAQAMVERLVARGDRNSALWQQTGYMCDLIVMPEGERTVQYYEDLTVDYVQDHGFGACDQYYTLTMEFGQERIDAHPDVFSVPRIHKDDVEHADESTGIHPIVRRYSRGKLLSEHHLIEDLASEFHEDVHVLPLLEYFRGELAAMSDGPANARMKQPAGEPSVHENVS